MAKVIYFGFPFHGHTNPTLGLIKELVDRGEQVIYYSDEIFREKIETTGAIFARYQTEGFAGTTEVRSGFADGIEEWISALSFIISYGQVVLENMFADIQQEHPAYIIHDACAYWGKQIAASLKVPGICAIVTQVFDEKMIGTDPDLFLRCVLRISPATLELKYGIKKVPQILETMAYYLKTVFEKEIDINDLILPREELNIVYTSRMFQSHQEYFD